MSVGVLLPERRNTVRKIQAQILLIFLYPCYKGILPATKELVPTNRFTTYFFFFFFWSLLLQSQRISGSPVSAFVPWVIREEAAGSRLPPPAPKSSSGCGRHFHFQAAESTQLLQPHTGVLTGFWAQQLSWHLQQDSSKKGANHSTGQHCAA